MNPEKIGLAIVQRVEPPERPVGGYPGPAFDGHPSFVSRGGGSYLVVVVVVVDLETLIEPVSTLQNDCRHEGGGPVAGLGEPLGESRNVLGQVVGRVIADPVARWVQTGEQRGVSWGRHRGGGNRMFEDNARVGEAGQSGSLDVVGSVRFEMVRPRRIERDQ